MKPVGKKTWNGGRLPFREILESGSCNFGLSKQFHDIGVELIENTPDEIKSLAIEMDERLNGNWQTDEEDSILQNKFEKILMDFNIDITKIPRMGSEFLRQNHQLLE